jgi:hypothetical protein
VVTVYRVLHRFAVAIASRLPAQDACCAACNADTGCRAWVWSVGAVPADDGKTCWLLGSCPSLTPVANRVVGGHVGGSGDGPADPYPGQFLFGGSGLSGSSGSATTDARAVGGRMGDLPLARLVVHPIAWAVDPASGNTTTATTFLPRISAPYLKFDGSPVVNCGNTSSEQAGSGGAAGQPATGDPPSCFGGVNTTDTFDLGSFPVYVPEGTLLPFQTLASSGAAFADPLV